MTTAFQGSKCVRGGLKRREYQVRARYQIRANALLDALIAVEVVSSVAHTQQRIEFRLVLETSCIVNAPRLYVNAPSLLLSFIYTNTQHKQHNTRHDTNRPTNDHTKNHPPALSNHRRWRGGGAYHSHTWMGGRAEVEEKV